MKKVSLLFFFLALLVSARASHIVGGEFELRYISGNRYKLSLIWYFDQKNNPNRVPQAEEPTITVSIFRKFGNLFIRTETLSFDEVSDVNYTNDECSKAVITDKLVYTKEIELNPNDFSDPQGYYVSWERCCRNYSINNIYSEDPEFSSRWAGQTFYMEFPPVVKEGQPFINNSPRLFPPLNDFACPFIPYYVDFAGVDDDGDSLVYSMVTPLSTHTGQALPPTGPAPYPNIAWRPGFGLDDIVDGVTNLEISTDGFLTVTPKTVGLFAFAVKCEEFRNGVKIGEIIRDFQMVVTGLGNCPDPLNPPKPSIVGKGPTDTDFGTTGKLTVSYANTVPVEDRCFEVKVSNPSTILASEGNQENIKIKAIALDFKKNISEVLPNVTTAFIVNGEEAFFQICFPNVCPYKPGGTFKIGIVASDDACALPLTDTLYVTATIEPPPNEKPMFSNAGGLTDITETLQEGDVAKSWPLQVTDADGDVINYKLVAVDFTLANVGMTFTSPSSGQQLGPVDKVLTWDPKCDVYDFTRKTNFLLYFIAEDNDLCKTIHADTTSFDLTIDLPGNNDPVIDNSILTNADTLEINAKIYGDPIVIDVTGTDLDIDDTIVLRGSGADFTASTFGAIFPKQTGKGTLESEFRWQLDCSTIDLATQTDFEFRLMVVDSTNKCRFYKADTLHVLVHVEPPDNLNPELDIISENPDQPIVDGSITALLGSPIHLTLSGTDGDISPSDFLKLELVDKTGTVTPTGFVFTPKEGVGPLQTSFTWSPECSIFENDVYENDYTFKFVLGDNRCFNEKGDSVTINMTIKDVDGGDEKFLPPNVFTPNGDGKNDFFAMIKETLPGEYESILPNDNCIGEFVRVTIYNRWGKQVYQSENRDFKWYGTDMPVGVYYYYILYTNKSYKGTVSLRY